MGSRLHKDNYLSWLYLLVISMVNFFTIGFLDAYGVLLVFLVDYFKESNSKTAGIGSLAFFCTFALYPFTIRMRNKLGTRLLLLLGGAFVLPAFLLSPLMPTMDFLFITFSIPFGIACSIVDCTAYTTILEYFHKYQGVAFGVRIGTGALGTMMYYFLLPVLVTEFNWKVTFWILTSMSLTCVFYASVYRTPKPSNDCSIHCENNCLRQNSDGDNWGIYFVHLKSKTFLMFLFAIIAFYSGVLMPPIFMVRIATNNGYHITKAGWLMVVRTIVSVPTRFIVGRLGDLALRYKKVRHVVLLIMVMFCSMTILCSFTTSLALFISYMAVVSIMDSIYWTIQPLFVAEITRGKHPDKGFALFNCIGSFALLVGPPVLGWLYDSTGNYQTVFYATSAMSATGVCLMAFGLFLSPSPVTSPLSSEDSTRISDPNSSDSQGTTLVPWNACITIQQQKQQRQYITAV